MNDFRSTELVFNAGGRPYNNKDFRVLQQSVLDTAAFYQAFSNVNGGEFIVSGCTNLGDPGFVWLGTYDLDPDLNTRKLRVVEEWLGPPLTYPCYITVLDSTQDRIYQDTLTKTAFATFKAEWSQSLPSGDFIIFNNSSEFADAKLENTLGSIGVQPWLSGGGGSLYYNVGSVAIGKSVAAYPLDVLGQLRLDGTTSSSTGGRDLLRFDISSDNGYATMLVSRNGVNNAEGFQFYNIDTGDAANLLASRYISTIATGTSPLLITSTTQVDNLNSQFVGGIAGNNIVTLNTNQTISGSKIISNSIKLNDNVPLIIGTSNTAEIRFTSGNTRYNTNSGSHVFTFNGNTAALFNETEIVFRNSSNGHNILTSSAGNLALYYQNSLRLDMTSSVPNWVNSSVKFRGAAAAISLGATTSDHVFMEFYARAAAPSSRSAYIGYPNAGSDILEVRNEIGILRLISNGDDVEIGGSGGDVKIKDSNNTVRLNINTAGVQFTGTLSGPTITITGIGTANDWIATSDQSLKYDIVNIENSLNLVKNLRGVKYKRKDSLDNNKIHYGLIAQEVEKVIPELVEFINEEKTLKGVNYNKITSLLIEAIKDQQTQIDSLKKLIMNGN